MPYGTVNADVIGTSVAGANLGAGNASLMKNRIINGAMVIDQRNAGASVTPNNSYTLDRWQGLNSTTGKFTVQQNAGSVTPPAGFTNYLGVTSSSAYSLSSTDYFALRQPIEGYNVADLGWGTASAKTVTFSFQVYSSLTGTFGGVFQNNGNSRSYPFTYTISSANTWTTISITITGDTSGTWATTNGVGIWVTFGLGVGATYSGTAGSWSANNYVSATGATSVVSTNGATFYITGVQLEVGSSATGFEYRQYTNELQLCQRYLPAYNLVGGQNFCVINAYSSGNWITAIPTPVQTRVPATGLVYVGTVTNLKVYYNATVISATDIVLNGCTRNSVSFNISSGGTSVGITGLLACETPASTLYFTGCEL